MLTRKGLTLLELLIVIVCLTIVLGITGYTWVAGVHLWSTGDSRARMRADVSQGVERITRVLRQATAITSLTSSGVTFTADLGAGSTSYRVYLYHAADPEPNPPFTQSKYEMRWAQTAVAYGDGAVLARNIVPPGTALFLQAGDLITVDMTASDQNQTFRVRTSVRPRNL